MNPRPRHHGFTMIELVIVMAMLGLLLSLALPQYMSAMERGREQVLQHNLTTMREAIDKFYGDRGRYPEQLEDLVTERYLRAIPNDPFTLTPSWLIVAPRDSAQGGVIDVQSTLRDADGAPRVSAVATEPGTSALPDFVSQEGGARRVSEPGRAASAATVEIAP